MGQFAPNQANLTECGLSGLAEKAACSSYQLDDGQFHAQVWQYGFSVGTLHAFSMPWWSTGDLQDYKERFGLATAPAVSWHLVPLDWPGIRGAALELSF